jgi:hypothetical protein
MARLLLLLDARAILRRRVWRAFEAEPRIFEHLLAIHIGETSAAQAALTGARFSWQFLMA